MRILTMENTKPLRITITANMCMYSNGLQSMEYRKYIIQKTLNGHASFQLDCHASHSVSVHRRRWDEQLIDQEIVVLLYTMVRLLLSMVWPVHRQRTLSTASPRLSQTCLRFFLFSSSRHVSNWLNKRCISAMGHRRDSLLMLCHFHKSKWVTTTTYNKIWD